MRPQRGLNRLEFANVESGVIPKKIIEWEARQLIDFFKNILIPPTMNKLKHQILEHLVKHGELGLEPADYRFKGDPKELDTAAQELDGAGHAVYTRTMDRLFLAAGPKTEKALKDGVYAEKVVDPVKVEKPKTEKKKPVSSK